LVLMAGRDGGRQTHPAMVEKQKGQPLRLAFLVELLWATRVPIPSGSASLDHATD
jgi:hypothetical protein